MKLFLNSLFLFFFLSCSSAFGDVFFKKYIVYVSGIKIGELNWEVKIDNKNYSNKISLKSGGLLSRLYGFRGEYFSSGNISNKILKSKIYKHSWKTKKADKIMSLVFNNNKLKVLEQSPIEKESLRLNIYEINGVRDPLSSFLQIVIGANSSKVVDGRRLYTMTALYDAKVEQTIIKLDDYLNLWTDHKRSDFEKIAFQKNKVDFLPSKIFINLDGKVFKLKEG